MIPHRLVAALPLLLVSQPCPAQEGEPRSGAASASTAPPERQPGFRYAAAVSYSEGRCRFWTGDVRFDGSGFRDDLERRFDRSVGITLFHAESVPVKCMRKAERLARSAGFSDVTAAVGTVELGPR